MNLGAIACGVPLAAVAGFMLYRALRNKGRTVHFTCTRCGRRESILERGLDLRAALRPVCGCGGEQTCEVEGEDISADVETFGRSASEGGSLVMCPCGARGLLPAAGDVTVFSQGAQVSAHVTPVACPRCGTPFMLHEVKGGPTSAEGACACGVAPVSIRRGLVLRCGACGQRSARVALMS
jgi:hypothetical protein